LTALAETLEAESPAAARALRETLESWWREQLEWNRQTASLLTLHHEINNALVGVRGNAQLLMIGPAGKVPGVRERLEVVIRESERIQQAASRIRGLRAALGNRERDARAA
jgi:nitrogen-specific signal transduction histidine kinase